MNKTFKTLEIIWLLMGCIGIFMCVYSLAVKDNSGAIYFLAFFVICGIMYIVRRSQRKKFEEAEKRKKENKSI